MSMTVGYLTDQAGVKFADDGNNEVTEADWIKYFNLSQAMIVGLLPAAFTRGSLMDLVAGVLQTLPSNTVELIDIPMNMTDGSTPGAPIRETTLEIMNECCPDWTTDTASAIVEHFMRVPDNDLQFRVYPKNDGTGKVEIQTAMTPPLVIEDDDDAWRDQPIALGDKYASAILNAMMFNACDEDTDAPGNTVKSDQYYNRMMQALGLKTARQTKKEATR